MYCIGSNNVHFLNILCTFMIFFITIISFSRTENMSDSERLRISEYLTQTIHIESRPVDPQLYHGQKQGEPRRYVWVRAMEDIGKNIDVC